jgi:hypothetical protein
MELRFMKKLMILLISNLFSAALFAGLVAVPPGPMQGGENVATAFVVTDPLPVVTSGTTAGYIDDYDESCPYPGGGAPDVVYSYTPVSDVTVDIDLCGSSFDTKLYIYENIVTSGSPYACDDDFYLDTVCGYYVSKIESLFLTGGNTYFIVIDGYDLFSFGDYDLSIIDNSPPPPCTWGVDIICPQFSISENEPCGSDTNGGCEMAQGTENWESIPDSGAVFCGTLWADGGNRDTDQYELVLTEPSLVILTADADQQIEFGLLAGGTGGYGGNPDCAAISGVSPADTAGPCSQALLDLGLLSSGTYWFSVSMTADNGYPCDNHYWIQFDVIPQPCPPPWDLTATDITDSSAMIGWTETGSATQWEYQIGLTGFTPAGSGGTTTLNPQPVTGLAADTGYDFYVRSFCDPAFSDWAGPFTFVTLCGTIASIPWTEGFESVWPPDCWIDSDTMKYGWDWSTFGSARSGSEWAYCNLAGSSLTTAEFNLPSEAVLSFWYRIENSLFPQDFKVKSGNDVLYQASPAINETYQSVYISLADYTGQTISITFLGESGGGGLAAGICIDDVSVDLYIIWTGNSDSDWDDPGNWSTGVVPTAADAVLIPSSPAGGNFPVVGGGITAECRHIWVSPGASVDVEPGSSLETKEQ